MPRYEYRNIAPTPDAEKTFTQWIDQLDRDFTSADPERRSIVVRDALHQLYLGRPYEAPDPSRHDAGGGEKRQDTHFLRHDQECRACLAGRKRHGNLHPQ